jgi:putative ABC transport system permease protein
MSSAIYRIQSTRTDLTLSEQKALARTTEDALAIHGIDVADASAGLLLSQNTTNGLTVLTTFLLIMAFLTASVGSIGLTGTMSMNVMERTREIGIMRAVGATNQIIIKLVLSEGAMIGLLSWLLSLVVSFPISKLMSDVINTAIFGSPTGFTYSILGPVLWMGIVIVLSLIASIMPAQSASQLTIREVLAYE